MSTEFEVLVGGDIKRQIIVADNIAGAKAALREILGVKRLPRGVFIAEIDKSDGYPPVAPVDAPEEKIRGTSIYRKMMNDELAEHLLAHPTISDQTWTSEKRMKGEKRPDFIQRVIHG